MFKIGDIVTGVNEDKWNYGEKFIICGVTLDKDKRLYGLTAIDEVEYCIPDHIWEDSDLKLVVEEPKCEGYKFAKTFKEVIAVIKDDEVWENEFTQIIKGAEYGIEISAKNGFSENTVSLCVDVGGGYKLLRKQYDFYEAFEAFGLGKEIESVVTKCRLRKGTEEGKIEIVDNVDLYWKEFELSNLTFDYSEIKGDWYIND